MGPSSTCSARTTCLLRYVLLGLICAVGPLPLDVTATFPDACVPLQVLDERFNDVPTPSSVPDILRSNLPGAPLPPSLSRELLDKCASIRPPAATLIAQMFPKMPMDLFAHKGPIPDSMHDCRGELCQHPYCSRGRRINFIVEPAIVIEQGLCCYGPLPPACCVSQRVVSCGDSFNRSGGAF